MELNISDRAREYQRSDESDGTTATAFENGAEWMLKELTRWHDPRENIPAPQQNVLVKDALGMYSVDWFEPEFGTFYGEYTNGIRVVAWRYIHE